MGRLVTQVAAEANGIILNAGEQGRLLIKEAGDEIRVTANEVLSRAFQGQEMMIQALGEEGRLTIQAAGVMLRYTLHDIPRIAGLVAQQTAEGFTFGLRNGLFGVGEVGQIIHQIRSLLLTPSGGDMKELLTYVYEQHQIKSPKDKAQLYQTLINGVNSPQIPIQQRFTLFLLIGSTAYQDFDLQERNGYLLKGCNYADEIVKKIPGEAKAILEEKKENAMDYFQPKMEPLPNIEEAEDRMEVEIPNKGQIEEDLALYVALENAQAESEIQKMQITELSEKIQNDRLIMEQLQQNISQQNARITALEAEAVKKQKEVESLRSELVFERNRDKWNH